jgi:hypothetical protein
MLKVKVLSVAILLAATGAGWTGAAAKCPAFTSLDSALLEPPPEVTPEGNPRNYRQWIYQEFPAYGLRHVNSVSAWAIRVSQRSTTRTKGNLVLSIERAIYITSEGKRIEVLGGLWPQQIIVPYAQSTDVVYDLWTNPPLLSMTESQAALAPCGALGPAIYPRNWSAAKRELAPPSSPRAIYVKEIRETGVANVAFNGYSHPVPPRPTEMRRGFELVVWGISDADNSDNVIEYHFRDDGEITALVGPGGWNTTLSAPNRAQSGNTPHAHTVLWRLRPSVADSKGGDSISVVEYDQHVAEGSAPSEHFMVTPLSQETALVFDATKLTNLRISDPDSFNEAAPGKPPEENSYVMTLVTDGTPRHRLSTNDDGSGKRFDFAIVREHAEERAAQPISKRGPSIEELLNDEPLLGENAIIYAYSTIAHIPRAEDFVVHPGAPDYEAEAPANRTTIRWSGIRLTPRNVYTRAPFTQPTPEVAATSLAPLPLTRACAPLAAAPSVEELSCEGGRRRYAVTLSPINQNPFGEPATQIEISGAGILGSPLRLATELKYGEAEPIAAVDGDVVIRPELGEEEVCFSVAIGGADWRCPAETQCVKAAGGECTP